ncbi:hypothetical protein G6F58_013347 [Rhizopus delemar]|nr:hypothetical protein G6F58_013347 [Rhizopus delemar]
MKFGALQRRVKRCEQVVTVRLVETQDHWSTLSQVWRQGWSPLRIVVVGLAGGCIAGKLEVPGKRAGGVRYGHGGTGRSHRRRCRRRSRRCQRTGTGGRIGIRRTPGTGSTAGGGTGTARAASGRSSH